MISPGPFLCSFLVVASVLGAGCGAGTVVDLGDATPAPYRFGTPRLLAELGADFGNENPSLTGDLLELYYNSNHGEMESDLWLARRDSVAAPFSAPALVEGLNTPGYDVNPAVTTDGLSLYFASDRPGGAGDFDIYRVTRTARTAPWSAAENLAALNSPVKDIPRPPGQHGLVLPVSSVRATADAYQLYLSARPSLSQPFATPVLVAELASSYIGDAFLSDDGLTLFHASAPVGGKPDLFVSWRKSTSQPFSVTAPLTDLNSDADERDPWLSPDGSTFYFASDRSGVLQIYEVSATRPSD